MGRWRGGEEGGVRCEGGDGKTTLQWSRVLAPAQWAEKTQYAGVDLK